MASSMSEEFGFLYALHFKSDTPDGMMDVIRFCMDKGLIARGIACTICGNEMTLARKKNIIDKHLWVCRTQTNYQRHQATKSIRKGSIFESSKLALTQVLIMTYLF